MLDIANNRSDCPQQSVIPPQQIETAFGGCTLSAASSFHHAVRRLSVSLYHNQLQRRAKMQHRTPCFCGCLLMLLAFVATVTAAGEELLLLNSWSVSTACKQTHSAPQLRPLTTSAVCLSSSHTICARRECGQQRLQEAAADGPCPHRQLHCSNQPEGEPILGVETALNKTRMSGCAGRPTYTWC